MKKTQLKILLSKLEPVEDKKSGLEQYQTPPKIAAELLTQAELAGDLESKVMDLGSGNGILAIGAAVLGAETVYAYDIDADAIAVAEENKQRVEEELERDLPVIFEEQDVEQVDKEVDTIVMNPPFGLQRGNKQENKVFLEKAFELASATYALLHQSENKREQTRDHLRELAKQYGFETRILSWFRFPIPREYAFHEKERVQVNVDLYKFFRTNPVREDSS